MQPLKMRPVFKERVWGGRRLADLLGKPLPAGKPIGESWELADHPRGLSTVADGPFAGKTLRWILENHRLAVLGEKRARGKAARFPVLAKFIDASDRLSVQVHPDDAYAAAHHGGDRGNTKCWVVLHAEPDAWVIDGLRDGVTRDAFASAVEKGTLENLFTVRPVKAGDLVWIPAGHVHAIGPGIVVAEIQQNSDVTYHVYDWDRTGLDGKPRALHVADALETINFTGDEPAPRGRGRTADETGLLVEHLVECRAFSLSCIQLDGRPWAADTGGGYVALIVLAGAARLVSGERPMPIRAGDTVLVPADASEYVFEAAERLTVLAAAPQGRAPTQ
ncbi:MAG TPA: type I phosphomannose isomerase catalytic subunit [Phycisphaerae bacterium]|nr:type I phosphomannose isomerase catalytic subunit [Phycisphaerae bacterium]